ncbi:MAG: DNA-3-methyladenine glycosylase 2 family protein [Actinobacteria bacterium]|nr:DNA-3-methyladenine glycosylase 2 family protein [Actinomycetota bacterium]
MKLPELASFEIRPAPPFRLDLTAWALRRRPDNVIDRWDGQVYRRVLVLGGRPAGVAVTQSGPAEAPVLEVAVTGDGLEPGTEAAVSGALERLLGFRLDLTGFYRFASADPQLGPLAERFRGFKPPRFPTLFETLANAIACQQVTLTLGIRLLGRLADVYGPVATNEAEPVHAFPRAEDLVGVDPETLRSLGFSFQKGRYLVGAARAVLEDGLDLAGLAAMGEQQALERLLQLRGVGRWTAEYVLLRGLGRLHVFPGDDVGARNNLQRWLGMAGPLDYEAVRRNLDRWHPYEGLIYFHLLLSRLVQLGYVD